MPDNENSSISPLLKGYCPNCFRLMTLTVAQRKGENIKCVGCGNITNIKELGKIVISPIINGKCPHCSSVLHFTIKQRAGGIIICTDCNNEFLITDVKSAPQIEARNTPNTGNNNTVNNNILTSNGRMGRSYFFIYSVIYWVLYIFGYLLINTEDISFMVVGFPLILVLFPLNIVLIAKRLHDLNYSGFWAILTFIPFINIVLHIYLLFAPGTLGQNNYGSRV